MASDIYYSTEVWVNSFSTVAAPSCYIINTQCKTLCKFVLVKNNVFSDRDRASPYKQRSSMSSLSATSPMDLQIHTQQMIAAASRQHNWLYIRGIVLAWTLFTFSNNKQLSNVILKLMLVLLFQYRKGAHS